MTIYTMCKDLEGLVCGSENLLDMCEALRSIPSTTHACIQTHTYTLAHTVDFKCNPDR